MPLRDRRFAMVGAGPVVEAASELLRALGADVLSLARVTPALRELDVDGMFDATGAVAATEPACPAVTVPAAIDAPRAWAGSGAMALTGRPDGPPCALTNPDLPARLIGAGAVIRLLAAAVFGARLEFDPLALLGERAAIAGFTRRGSVTVGGHCEMIAARDGWIALNLARPEDLDLVPAWLDGTVASAADWTAVRYEIAQQPIDALIAKGAELGLALGAPRLPAIDAWSPYALDTPAPSLRRALHPAGKNDRAPTMDAGNPFGSGPLVVDLTSLWAGPLAGGLLAACGATVIKVEGANRPDGARRGPAAFFDLLNAGKRCIAVDFRDRRDVARLQALIARASLVLEASRPRVMDNLGIDPATVAAGGTSWVSLTAYGRYSAERNRVGFGDDVAVSAGLIVPGSPPLFVADAIADPIGGLYATVAALACLGASRACVVDLPLVQAAAHAARPLAGAPTATEQARLPDGAATALVAAPPRARPIAATAEAFGASTAAVGQWLDAEGIV